MIFLGQREYRDKVYACWLGKSIGGTMGAPYEFTRDYLSITGFASDTPESLPNDDLDLQLIWLQALEFSGVKNITAQTLGEYWLAFITPFWAEYGITKSNMRKGLPPSVAGDYANVWKHSNGAWIRTEIWATLAPAAPAVAAKYAAEDAKVDHGTGEGSIAAVFVAALESAAFVLQDVRKLIHIALGYIPEDSRVAKTVLLAESCFDSGMALREARDKLIAENADIGDGWFQAPTNVGFVILGLLYGGGDFKKSMLAAINCGDDTDCTGATIGAIMGILGGTKAIPKDWRAHVGDTIVTGSINMGVSWIPVTSCKQLSERIFRLVPAMLAENNANVCISSGKTKIADEELEKLEGTDFADIWKTLQPYTFCMPFAFFTAQVRYCGGPVLLPNGTACIMLKLYNNVKAYGNQPYDLQVRVLLPKGVTADRTEFCVHLPHWSSLTTEYETSEIPIKFFADETLPASVRVVLEVAAVFRGDTLNGCPLLYVGFSKDGYTFDICDQPICMEKEDGKPYAMEYGYDPRVVQIGDTYYVLWCDGLQGQPTIGLAETKDFKKFVFKGHPVLPYSRNGVLFPRKIGGEYVLLTRPSDQGHTPYGDIYLSYSRDLTYWGNHKLLMQPKSSWERLKIGAGPAPIETNDGWLLLYHGVTQTCSGYVYSMGGALLDLNDPSKILHRSENYLLTPEKEYECFGFVPNVVFPCSTLTDSETGRIALYYGCADTVFSLAFSTIDQIIKYIIKS